MTKPAENHFCGQCELSFGSEKEYNEHVCKVTGFNPTQPEHLGERFKRVSEAALKRGSERK